jgi:DNA repair protein RadA/Sms
VNSAPSFTLCATCKRGKIPEGKLRCPFCNAWNTGTVVEEKIQDGKDGTILITEISETDGKKKRFATGPWDDNFGEGGVEATSINLIAGVPGCGKSTLLMQVLSEFGYREQAEVLYIGLEENGLQYKERVLRLKLRGAKYIRILPMENIHTAPSLQAIIEFRRPIAVVVDSLSKMNEDLDAQAGICDALKLIATRLLCPFFVIGHTTKEEGFAGTMKLQHAVDATLMMYKEDHPAYKTGIRIFKTHKNRNGPDNVESFYEMTERGLRAIEDPDKDSDEE